jgi:hypothetical protein
MIRILVIALTSLNILWLSTAIAQQSPYQDFKERDINSLSQDQIEGYLEGRGMGMALPAELNNYPGPKHVLELSDSLKIDAEQERRIRQIYEEMREEAVELGKSIVEKEKELDQSFASGEITTSSLASRVSEISELKGKLRFTHLRAHLGMVEVLKSDQIERYNQLRGYGKESLHHPHMHGRHNGNN